jgi:hypothetical protein
VGQAGGGEQTEDHPDEDAVVAAVVVAAQEQADRVAGEEHRQGECHASEGAFDDPRTPSLIAPGMFHHSKAAMTIESPMRKKAVPSRFVGD